MNIHENIRKARKSAGVTQTELAAKVGVHQKDISRWESGDRTPSVEALAAICIALKVSADTLLEIGIKSEKVSESDTKKRKKYKDVVEMSC